MSSRLQEMINKELGMDMAVNLEAPPWETSTPQVPWATEPEVPPQIEMPEAPPSFGTSAEKPRDLSTVPLSEWTHDEVLRMLPMAVRAAAALRKSWGEPMDAALYAIVYIAVSRRGVSREELVTRWLGAEQMKRYWKAIRESNQKWPDKAAFWKLAFSLAGNHRKQTRVAFLFGTRVRFTENGKNWYYTQVKLRTLENGGAEVCLG